MRAKTKQYSVKELRFDPLPDLGAGPRFAVDLVLSNKSGNRNRFVQVHFSDDLGFCVALMQLAKIHRQYPHVLRQLIETAVNGSQPSADRYCARCGRVLPKRKNAQSICFKC